MGGSTSFAIARCVSHPAIPRLLPGTLPALGVAQVFLTARKVVIGSAELLPALALYEAPAPFADQIRAALLQLIDQQRPEQPDRAPCVPQGAGRVMTSFYASDFIAAARSRARAAWVPGQRPSHSAMPHAAASQRRKAGRKRKNSVVDSVSVSRVRGGSIGRSKTPSGPQPVVVDYERGSVGPAGRHPRRSSAGNVARRHEDFHPTFCYYYCHTHGARRRRAPRCRRDASQND